MFRRRLHPSEGLQEADKFFRALERRVHAWGNVPFEKKFPRRLGVMVVLAGRRSLAWALAPAAPQPLGALSSLPW